MMKIKNLFYFFSRENFINLWQYCRNLKLNNIMESQYIVKIFENGICIDVSSVSKEKAIEIQEVIKEKTKRQLAIQWFNEKDAYNKSELSHKYFKETISYNFTALTGGEIESIYDKENPSV